MAPLRPQDLSTAGGATTRSSFSLFYERELLIQFRRARLIVGSTAVAEDVVHQAFVEVWSRWDQIDDPGPYLNRSVLNGARDRYRRERRQLQILRLRSAGSDRDLPEHEILTDVLGQLPFNQRSAIVLRYYGGLADTEIAAAMGCPTGSVGPWIHRGLAKLRKALR